MTVTINQLAVVGLASYLGESPEKPYFAQTFKAGGAKMQSLDFLVNTVSGPDATDYRLLITSVRTDGNGFHPDAVLKEIALSEPFDGDTGLHQVHVDLSALGLVSGKTYAFVLDSFTDADGEPSRAQLGMSLSDTGVDYVDGIFSLSAGVGDTREEDFAGDWTETPWDLAFAAVFSNPGAIITGTKGKDRIDASHAPGKQSKATADDDSIVGKGGNDKVDALAGFDILDGGKGNDKLSGGEDDDLLIGGKGRDQLIGGAGEDEFLFNTKLGERDKIKDFAPTEDVILLSRTVFKALPLGTLVETAFAGGKAVDSDDRIVYRANGIILYDKDGVGDSKAVAIAKLSGVPVDLTHLDFVVVG